MRWDNLLHDTGRSFFVLAVSDGVFDSMVLL